MKKIFILTALFAAVIGSAVGQTEIRTAEELAAIGTDRETLSGSYILMNDLTLDDWVPIGRMDHGGETLVVVLPTPPFWLAIAMILPK